MFVEYQCISQRVIPNRSVSMRLSWYRSTTRAERATTPNASISHSPIQRSTNYATTLTSRDCATIEGDNLRKYVPSHPLCMFPKSEIFSMDFTNRPNSKDEIALWSMLKECYTAWCVSSWRISYPSCTVVVTRSSSFSPHQWHGSDISRRMQWWALWNYQVRCTTIPTARNHCTLHGNFMKKISRTKHYLEDGLDRRRV
jgi:hypothetical protein